MANHGEAVDIFGRPLELSDAEKALVGTDRAVFLRKPLQVETLAKKGDATEPKTLVVTSSRCYVLTYRAATKVETSFNFLSIKLLECSDKKITFHLNGEAKSREFLSSKDDTVQIAALISAQLRSLFPVTTMDTLLKTSYATPALGEEIGKLQDDLLCMMERSDPSSLEGFITVYGFVCDHHGTPYHEDVSSYLRAVYHNHGFKDFTLNEFEYLSLKDLHPLVAALRHNQYFDGLTVQNIKLTPEIIEELALALKCSQTLKKLVLNNCSIRYEMLFQYAVAWKKNSKSVLSHLDLSNNPMDEKNIEQFCTVLESLQHGLQVLVLSNCKMTPKIGSQLALAMKNNSQLAYSLTTFDLSSNPLGPDPQASLSFLQEPQTINSLNLSKCGLSMEFVFPVLHRGCQQHLAIVNLAQNKSKKPFQVASTGHGAQQFCSSAIALEKIDISDCKLPAEFAMAILEGLSVNPNLRGVDIDLSGNDLTQGVDVGKICSLFTRMKNITSLHLANTGIDVCMSKVLESLGQNKSIQHLQIGQNFGGKGRSEGVSQLCKLVSSEECMLKSLDVSDSKLKEATWILLDSLTRNTSIIKLDISGNGMGSRGLRALVKLLLSGCNIQELHIDHNEISVDGLSQIAIAMEHNYTVRSFPIPSHDVSKVVGREGVDEALAKIQRCVSRNHSSERFSIELADRHKRRLLTAAQQSALISREVVQLEELLRALEQSHVDHPDLFRAKEVKAEANKVVKLADSLYSPIQESQQYEAIRKRMEVVMEREVDQLFQEMVEENLERMVTRSVKACPSFLDDRTRESLRQMGTGELQDEEVDAKKAVIQCTIPELINHISGINLETAAKISELIVDRTLDELDSCSIKLLRLQEKSSASPSKKVRKFSFRTKDQQRPRAKDKAKNKVKTSKSESRVELPSKPLSTDGPVLDHLGKSRPKPVRKHRSRPSVGHLVDQNDTDGSASIWEALPPSDEPKTPNTVDSDSSKTPEPALKHKESPKPKKIEKEEKTVTKSDPAKSEKPDEEPSPNSTPKSSGKTSSTKKKKGLSRFFGSRKGISPSEQPSSSSASPVSPDTTEEVENDDRKDSSAAADGTTAKDKPVAAKDDSAVKNKPKDGSSAKAKPVVGKDDSAVKDKPKENSSPKAKPVVGKDDSAVKDKPKENSSPKAKPVVGKDDSAVKDKPKENSSPKAKPVVGKDDSAVKDKPKDNSSPKAKPVVGKDDSAVKDKPKDNSSAKAKPVVGKDDSAVKDKPKDDSPLKAKPVVSKNDSATKDKPVARNSCGSKGSTEEEEAVAKERNSLVDENAVGEESKKTPPPTKSKPSKSAAVDKPPKEEATKKLPPGAIGLTVNQLAGVLQHGLPTQKESKAEDEGKRNSALKENKTEGEGETNHEKVSAPPVAIKPKRSSTSKVDQPEVKKTPPVAVKPKPKRASSKKSDLPLPAAEDLHAEPGSPKDIGKESTDGDVSKKEEKAVKEDKKQSSTGEEKDPEKDVRQSESAESEGTGTNGESQDSI